MNSKVIWIAMWIILLIGPVITLAQNTTDQQRIQSSSIFVKDVTHFAEVGLGLLKAPLRFNRGNWGTVGLTLGSIALLFTTDKSTKKFVLRNQNKLNDFIFNMDRYQGNKYSLYFAWSIYGYGFFTRNNKVRIMGLNAVEAFIYSGTIAGIFKILIGRRRPFAGEKHLFFKPFQITNNEYQSLPSGHTIVSFAVSTALAKSLNNTYWKVFWYGTAGLVGASRIYHNQHWLSDVISAAVFGYYVGDYVVGFDTKEKPQSFSQHIQPWIGLNTVGLRIFLD